MTSPRSLFVASFTLYFFASSHAFSQTPEAERNWKALQHVRRGTPTALNHPGNVFLTDQAVQINVPEELSRATQWRVTNETGR